ncbi:MAG: ATP-binding protein [Holophagales bacterium]|nr:ATP-binding protein [Holophagales bacterium]
MGRDAQVILDRTPLNELVTLRFLEDHLIAIVGPVGVGKTFWAHALGHVALPARPPVLPLRTDRMLKTLRHARSSTAPTRPNCAALIAVDLLILDDFASTPWTPSRAAISTNCSPRGPAPLHRRHFQPRG